MSGILFLLLPRVIEFPAMKQQPNSKPTSKALVDSQIAGLVAQTGCLVVVVVLVAVIAGIWLDRALNTRPMLTLLLVLGSVPITIYMLMRIALRAVSRIQQETTPAVRERNDRDDES
jgi:F0F1-type ATP synthase assembly protein I